MKNKIELRNKIYKGAKSAIDKLISERAKKDEFLIVSDNGKIVKLPARKLKQN